MDRYCAEVNAPKCPNSMIHQKGQKTKLCQTTRLKGTRREVKEMKSCEVMYLNKRQSHRKCSCFSFSSITTEAVTTVLQVRVCVTDSGMNCSNLGLVLFSGSCTEN